MVMHQKTPPCSKGIETLFVFIRCFVFSRKTPPYSKGIETEMRHLVKVIVIRRKTSPCSKGRD